MSWLSELNYSSEDNDGSTYNDYWDDVIDGEPSLCPVAGCDKESGDINAPYCGEAHRRLIEDNSDNYTGPTYREYED